MSKLINLIYHINKEESSVKFDSDNKLSALKTLISLTQRINIDNHEILYDNKIFSFKGDKMLKELIGKDINPVFHIIKMKKTIISKKITNKIVLKKENCLVSIENAPSRAEIFTILSKFLENKDSFQEFVANNKGSKIDITFHNPVT